MVSIYGLSSNFPKEERYGLTTQMRRAAVSIPSNIAEGRHRGTRKDFRQFLLIAYGSAAELETQLAIALKLGFASEESLLSSQSLLVEIMKMLNVMILKLKAAEKLEANS